MCKIENVYGDIYTIKNQTSYKIIFEERNWKKTMNINIKFDAEKWYRMTLGIWFFFEIITQSKISKIGIIDIDVVDGMITGIVITSIIMLCIWGQAYTVKEMIIIAVISLVILVATITSHTNTMISAWLFIIAAKKLDLNKTVHMIYKILLITTLLVILLYLIGFIPEYTMYRNGVVRHSMGFSHPNQLALRVFQFIACHCYLRWEKFDFKDVIIISMLALFIIKTTYSQTAFVCIILLIILTVFTKFANTYLRGSNVLLGNIYWLASIFAMIISILFSIIDVKKYTLLNKLDQLASIRFSAAHKVYEIYGISLLGQRIFISEEERLLVGINEKLYLDSSYCTLLIRFGVLSFLIFVIAYFYTFYKFKNIPVMAVIFFTYSVYGIMEQNLISLMHNVFILTLAWTLYPKKCVMSW
jgi:hypothetical protein